MFKKTIHGLLCFVMVALFASTTIQAQSKTDIYKDQKVKRNSIIVKYDDAPISVKGKTTNSRALLESVRSDINARVLLNLEKRNVEEWTISTDMESTLKRLNSLPGVKAFPNYVFQREELDVQSLISKDKYSVTSNGASLYPSLETIYGSEIIFDGDFSSDSLPTAWSTFVADFAGVSATFGITNGEAAITDISGAGGEIWHVQLNQELSDDQIDALELGTVYELSFEARSDTSKNINVFFGKNGDDFIPNLSEIITITSDTTVYSIEFLVEEKWDNFGVGMKLGFEGGTSDAPMFIDNVSIKQVIKPLVMSPEVIERDSSLVISLFSDSYTDVPVDTWRTEWSNAVFEDDTVDGNAIKSYSALDFVGIETVANQIDITAMTHVHFDVWTPNADLFRIKLVDFGATGGFSGPEGDGLGDDTEAEIVIDEGIELGTWLSVDIPLYAFEGLEGRENLAQIIFSGAPVGELILFIDNLYFYDSQDATTDPLLELQYALNNDGSFNPGVSLEGADISAFEAWGNTRGSDDVVVVVYDDGVDFAHEDLKDNAWVNPLEDLNGDGEITPDEWNGIDDDGNGYIDDFWGWSAVYDDNSYLNDGSYHGTHVAGILGAQGDNQVGITGVSQEVSIISVMIFDEFGSTDAISIMRGYDYISSLLEGGTEITAINQSWGGGELLTEASGQKFVEVMTDYALHHNEFGALWVISAGNSGGDRDKLPFYSFPNNIQSPNIITVANTNDEEEISGSSDFGLRTVDVGAPGSNIMSTFPGDQYGFLSGTSMASPQVTGALALAKSMYPDESGHDLIARVLAGTDLFDQYALYFGDGGRLNANGALNPSSEEVEDGLIPSHELAKFHRTFIDGPAARTLGFINNTDNEISVSDISISGTDSDKFFLWNEFSSSTVASGGAFGVALGFDNGGELGEFTASIDITTSGGTVSIPLNGLEQTFGEVYISPDFADLGPVPYGTPVSADFSIFNDGVGELNYALGQELFVLDSEFSEFTETLKTFSPVNQKVSKQKVNREALINDIVSKIQLERSEKILPKIEYNPNTQYSRNAEGAEVLFYDDLNDAESVSENWEVLQVGEGDVWELVDLGGEEEVNNLFMMGDFETGYSNSTLTAAFTPVFDFTALEIGKSPAYLAFDVEVDLEEGYDFFYVLVFSNGQNVGTIASSSNGSIVNKGGYYRVYADISAFAGADNIEFVFVANTDSDYVEGFGVLFDNIEVVIDDAPYFTSSFGGTIASGEQEDITISVSTDLLPAGRMVLFTDVFSDGINAVGVQAPYHTLVFESRYANLALTPQFVDFGELSGEEPLEYSFTAENVGAVGVDYAAGTFLIQPDIFNDVFAANFAEDKQEALALIAEGGEKKSTTPFSPLAHKRIINERFDPSAIGSTTNVTRGNRSTLAPSLEDSDIYFEGFEEGIIPEGWFVDDLSFGLGHTFQPLNIGSEENPFNTLFVGDIEEFIIYNNTVTLAYSSLFDLSNTPSGDEIFMEFTFGSILEPGYDVASIWVGIDLEEGTDFYYLASTEDALPNDGNLRRIGVDITDFKGVESAFLVFVVETDDSYQSAFAMFDDVDIYSTETVAYVDSEFGFIDSAATQDFNVTINANWLRPGYYEAITVVDYFSFETFTGRVAEQVTSFSIENLAPVAVSDTIGVLAGDAVSFEALLGYILSNDYDEYGEVYLHDFDDPLYGSLKYTLEGPIYVAPLNFDGYDWMRYIITDGEKFDTASVWISVHAVPEFVKGSDQQYVFLEDNDLTLSTTGMAAGVGGQDKDLVVWASSNHESVFIEHDGENHTLSFSASENFFGQTSAEFYVGYPGEAILDSMTVSLVVIPVNDAPTAEFSIESEGQMVTFKDASNDNLDLSSGGIVKWEWNFGDGNISEERNPTHNFDDAGEYTVTLQVTDNGGLSDSFELQVPVTVSNENLSGVPTEYSLKQNYPNPFNPSTVINYSIPEAGKVSIVIYDMLGQKVAELVNAQKAVGNYTVNFNASGLSSGVYIYQIRAGKFTQTKKMLLIK